ncbi:hypothetical protein Csa_020801, partial [Cucumis sativus]
TVYEVGTMLMHSSLAIASFGSLGGIGLISCQSCHAASLPQIKNPKVHPSTEEAYHPKLSTVPARCSFLLICFVGCLSFQNLEIYL